ncbi:MAG: UDP-3-O-(3-hydroxymyristoyl)glucosamine N-acyltransferase [Bacteroidales bacterium]|jgi:UDP-3-O-[3-hydroxymyristoyl] glucosamine N-acyltransferase|nr:UDP-3-O-(3-hydroxymyristoyl)glucosamine N-acyltransferase [Bacteroidales bacterium]
MKIKQTTLKHIAELIGATYVGDARFPVTGFNEIHKVEAGDVTFVDHPKYYSKALNSAATVVLINKQVECPAGKALLIHDDPFVAFIQLMRHYRPIEPCTQAISPTAEIGEGTVIMPGSFVGNHTKVGKNCVIHPNVTIYDYCVIGDNVVIHSGSVIGADAYYFQRRADGYMKFESFGRVVIEDDVEIGALCSIDKGVTSDTLIRKGTKMDNHCQVGHDSYIGCNCLIGSHAAIAGVTRIEDDVILWGRVCVNKDLVIGEGAVVLATSAVDKNIEPGKAVFGVPAQDVRKQWREQAAMRKLPEFLKDYYKQHPDL